MSKSTEDSYHLRGQRGQCKVDRKEILTCFLCLKIVRSPHLSSPGCDGDTLSKKDVIDKKTLQALFRHLNVDGKDNLEKKVSSSKGKDGVKKEEETGEWVPDASKLLCKGCSLVTGELINLVEKLELTKIWINHWMRQLVNILSRSTIGPKSRKKKRGRLEDSFTSLLRTRIKKKCISKLLKTDFPRVRLEKHDDIISPSGRSGGDDKETSPLISINLFKEEHEEEQNRHDNLMEDMNQLQAPEEINEDIDVEPVVEVKQENATFTPQLKTRVVMPCPYCDETVTSNSGLNRHTAAFHPEQFLSSVKRAELSEQQFKLICQNMLSKLCQVRIIDKQLGCPYCPVTFGNRIYLKAHLIHGHHPILLKNLEQLQNGTVSATTTPTPKSLAPQRPKNFYCRYCRKRCNTQWSLKKHVLLIHRLSPSMPASAKKIQPKLLKQACEHCGEEVGNDYLKIHQKQCLTRLKELESVEPPPEQELEAPTPKNEVIPLDVVSWQCMECERSFATLDQLDSHRSQPNCNKIVEGTPGARRSFKCSECEASFWHLSSLGRHRKTCHPDPSSRGDRPAYYKELKSRDPKKIPCPLCGRGFIREDSLRRHIRTACRSVPFCQKKVILPHSQSMFIGSHVSASMSSNTSQSASGFIKLEPIVVPGDGSSNVYYDEDNDYDNSNMVPDYDPLM